MVLVGDCHSPFGVGYCRRPVEGIDYSRFGSLAGGRSSFGAVGFGRRGFGMRPGRRDSVGDLGIAAVGCVLLVVGVDHCCHMLAEEGN
jgi:hypothetical protein